MPRAGNASDVDGEASQNAISMGGKIEKPAAHHALNLLALLHNTLTRALDECMLVNEKYGDVGDEVVATGLVLASRADAIRQVIDSITAKRDGKLDFKEVVEPELTTTEEDDIAFGGDVS